jgi:hypothetical protein
MTIEQVRDNCAWPLKRKGYDLVHSGACYQVKALRHSPTNRRTCESTSRIKPGYDVLLAIIYAEVFSISALYRLTRWGLCSGIEQIWARPRW